MNLFEPYLSQWGLEVDGEPVITATSRLLPVRHHGLPAMLKISTHEEAQAGGRVLAWWNGDGAARVLAIDGDVLLMERALGHRFLAAMARSGQDDEATRIICNVITELHQPRAKDPPPDLVPLSVWFRELEPAAARYGGSLVRSAASARALLADPQDVRVLHGDIHHENILDFGERGWLAIDPKGLIGERGFDYANIFTNPDLSDPTLPVATLPDRFQQRLAIVTEQSGIEHRRLLHWIIAWCGLSAVWFIEDGLSPEIDFRIAELAIAELDR
jgi:streptomycin 6-kinase